MGNTAFNLDATYVHILDNTATTLAGGSAFWAGLMSGSAETRPITEGGWLVGIYPARETWQQWEMHPNGDELVQLLSGALDVVLELPDGERTVPLRGLEAILIPKGTWHTVKVKKAGQTLHITYGTGTEMRPA